VRGSEQRAHRPALRDPEERRAFAPRGIHHGPHIVDPLLEGRHLADRVGEAGAALVEDDQARERADPVEEASERK
jgi:hypothetical protein